MKYVVNVSRNRKWLDIIWLCCSAASEINFHVENLFMICSTLSMKLEIYNTIVIVSNQEIKMLINFIVHTNCVEERNMRRLEKLFYYVDLCKRLIAA